MEAITRRQILENKQVFADNEIVEVSAVALKALIIENKHLQDRINVLLNKNDILEALVALQECKNDHRFVDLDD